MIICHAHHEIIRRIFRKMKLFGKQTKSFFAKAMMVLLALTFIIWGMGDGFRSKRVTSVAEVDGEKISLPEWRDHFAQQAKMIERNIGRPLTLAEKQDSYFKNKLLEQLIDIKLLRAEAKRIGLIVDENTVKYTIANTPAFQTEGKFDKEKFSTILRNAGISDDKFIDYVHRDVEINTLKSTVEVDKLVPDALVENLLKAQGAIRKADLITIPIKTMDITERPLDADLEQILLENKSKFMIPEKRDISYIKLDENSISKHTSVPSDEELKEYYHSKTVVYSEPEYRDVTQIIIKTKSDALKAVDDLKAGTDFNAVAKKHAINNQGTKLTKITKGSLDKNISKAIFDTPKGKITEPIKTSIGWHIIRVDKITPRHLKPFEDVYKKLKAQYIQEKSMDELTSLSYEIEKEIDAGMDLEDVASRYDLKIYSQKNITKKSKGKIAKNMLNIAFSLEKEDISSVTPYEDLGAFFIVRADEIMPVKIKELATVRAKVTELWRKKVKNAKAYALALDIHNQIADSTQTIQTLLAKHKLPAAKKITSSYFSEDNKLPENILKKLLTMGVGHVSEPIFNATEQAYVIVKLNKITIPDAKKLEKHKALVKSNILYQQAVTNYSQLINHLRAKAEISKNLKL